MSFILWFCDSYYYYAATILIMSIFGITMAVKQTREVLLTLSFRYTFPNTHF